MMRRRFRSSTRLFIIAGMFSLGVLAAPYTDAIVIRHDRPDAAYQDLATQVPFCSLLLGGWGGGCTLIDPEWIITAAHAAGPIKVGDRIQVGGVTTKVAEIIAHPHFNTKNYHNDLALLRLVEAIPDQRPAPLYEGRKESGRRSIFVGRGYTGTGKTGATHGDKILRAAENEIEAVTEHWLKFVFDAPPDGLELEGISGPGDSGGPAFMVTESGLTLVGISSWQDNTGKDAEGVYGVKEHYTRISSYVNWIRRTMAHFPNSAPISRPGACSCPAGSLFHPTEPMAP